MYIKYANLEHIHLIICINTILISSKKDQFTLYI